MKPKKNELTAMMAAYVRQEIDACFIEAMRTGEPVKGIELMNIPDTPKWHKWAKNQQKLADKGDKLIKKYEKQTRR